MADQLEEIKGKIDIVEFISEYITLKKAGRNFKALCPFHSEKTSSFVVSPERQIWHCFGCQKGGDIFGFLMAIENLEFPEALEVLAKRAGVKLVSSYQASESSRQKEKIYKINHLASEFFHYLLLNHKSGKGALDYVLGRGVNKKSLETFSIGWSPNSWDSLMRFLIKKGYSPQEIETAGLIVSSQQKHYYDRFRGRLMFALKDHRGNVVGFAGRTLDAKVTEAKYINTSETPVYIKSNVLYGLDVTKDTIKKEDRAIIVEGEFDLISSFQAGVSNVVAIKGSALTEGHVNLLKRFTENIDLALDMDIAGDAAVKRGIEIADAAGFSIRVVKLPEGKDPDECARINPANWKKAVKSAVPIFDYFLDSALSRHDKQTAEGKKKIGDEVIPVIGKITNPIVQAHYLNRLSDILSVSEEVIAETAKKFEKKEDLGVFSAPVAQPNVSRPQLLEELMLAFILQSQEPEKIMDMEELKEIDKFLNNQVVKKTLSFLTKYLLKNKKFVIGEFIKFLPTELVPTIDRLYLLDLGKAPDDQAIFDRDFSKIIAEIKKIFLKNRLLALAGELKGTKESEVVLLRQEYQETALALKTLTGK